MKTLNILIPFLLLIACTNQPKENPKASAPLNDTLAVHQPWEAALNKYKTDLIIEPNLDTLPYIEIGKEYHFGVRNVPMDIFGAMINNGMIMKTDENQYMFKVNDLCDSVTMTLFVDIDTLRHTIYQMKKKIGK